MHPDVRWFMHSSCRVPTTVTRLEQQLMTPPFVVTTVFHSLCLVLSTFDCCIVDEASHITLRISLRPLRFADNVCFLIASQVQNPPTRKAGLKVSVFFPHASIPDERGAFCLIDSFMEADLNVALKKLHGGR
ncbi:hypothetical protein PILCRDRAFT_745265 [Piloderma croceum F 1598]|uniref:DNA2/NAM7 helicase helicase domain-containing protein n=1 Tax=Piloderma croceum (strain F 1598) TaxID=765440 RepID=A0A0C3AEH6_PILCF|nr:hypothetical protein PILCRDRAFT_745265 [Piloderma croceum F 1598]